VQEKNERGRRSNSRWTALKRRERNPLLQRRTPSVGVDGDGFEETDKEINALYEGGSQMVPRKILGLVQRKGVLYVLVSACPSGWRLESIKKYPPTISKWRKKKGRRITSLKKIYLRSKKLWEKGGKHRCF